MTKISEQLEAVIRDIETRTRFECTCDDEEGVHSVACIDAHNARVRGEIARTVERMIEATWDYCTDFRDPRKSEAVAAALKAGGNA